MLDEHLASSAVRLVEAGRAGALLGAAQLGQERHVALQHDALWHGAVSGPRGRDHKGGLRGLRGGGALPEPLVGTGCGDGQPFCPQGRQRVRKLIEGRGCELLYLPPYSPELNPIEHAFSKVKALLREAGARTREALIGAMGEALSAITSREASGFLRH